MRLWKEQRNCTIKLISKKSSLNSMSQRIIDLIMNHITGQFVIVTKNVVFGLLKMQRMVMCLLVTKKFYYSNHIQYKDAFLYIVGIMGRQIISMIKK